MKTPITLAALAALVLAPAAAAVTAETPLEKATAAFEAGEYPKVLELAAALDKSSADWARMRYLAGETQLLLGRTADAEKSFRDVLSVRENAYVEAARAFGERMVREGGKDAEARIQFAYREALSRAARAEEIKVLSELVERQRKSYEGDAAGAAEFLKVGQKPVPQDIPAAELAAWTSAARVILNLNEVITRN